MGIGSVGDEADRLVVRDLNISISVNRDSERLLIDVILDGLHPATATYPLRDVLRMHAKFSEFRYTC